MVEYILSREKFLQEATLQRPPHVPVITRIEKFLKEHSNAYAARVIKEELEIDIQDVYRTLFKLDTEGKVQRRFHDGLSYYLHTDHL